MSRFLLKVLDFYVYSSIHISLCAMGMTWYAYRLYGDESDLTYVLFIGGSTWLLYSIHRIVGIERVGKYIHRGRYAVIKRHKNHIYYYAVLAAIMCGWFFFKLSNEVKVAIIIPSIISLFYVSPLFPGKRRLRDLSWTKILMIAVCWSWLSTVIPGESHPDSLIWGISRLFFLFGITIPFDLRDKEVDAQSHVKTIAHFASANVLTVIAVIAILISYTLPISMINLTPTIVFTESMVHLITLIMLIYSLRISHDYMYSLFLDGSMGVFYVVYILKDIFL